MKKAFFILFLISLHLQLTSTANLPSTTVGTLFYDTFQNLSKWVPRTTTTAACEIKTNVQGNESVLHFTAAKGSGDIFTIDSFDKHPNHGQVWIIFDYLDIGATNTDCLIYVGFGPNYDNVSQWLITGEGSSYNIAKYQGNTTWDHFEILIDYSLNTFHASVEDNTGVSLGCYMDNFLLASYHGPDQIRQDPYNQLIQGFEVLSVDYSGYTSTSESQFNFDVATVNQLLNRANNSPLNGEKFAVYIPAKNLIEEVLLYSTTNGGSIGDGYGRFVTNSYGSNQQFKPGDFIFFDTNLSTDKNSYDKKSGTCMYDGPFRQQEYSECYDNCKDYATLLEASYYCQRDTECLGITYSHKYWGGSSSTGYIYEGYGYQLRKGTLNSNSSRKFVHSWTKNPKNFIQLSSSEQCIECKFGCNGCYLLKDNCNTCIGSNRILPACDCPVGYYDDGVNADCQKCDDKCSQCENQYNEFYHVIEYGPIHYHNGYQLMPNEQDYFGNTGTVYEVKGMMRLGKSTANTIPTLKINEKYQLCLWLKIAPGSTIDSATSFSFDIGDTAVRRYKTDEYGTILNPIGSSLGPFLTTDWGRFCVNGYRTTNANYNFMDVGDYGDNTKIFYYANPQLVKIFSKDAQPVPYIVGKKSDSCQFCAHYTRIGVNCECSPGYYESTTDPTQCESPKPSECDYYIRMESAGWLPNSPGTATPRGNVFLNDVKLGQDSTRGLNFFVLDNNYALEDQQAFDSHASAQEVLDMIQFINGLASNKIVLVLAFDSASSQMTDDAYTALQTLGLNQYTKLQYRDSLAMIGRKGATPGSVQQITGKQISKGTANLVGCLQCSKSCFQCIDVFNQFPIIQGSYENEVPQLNSSLTDFQGNTGTVYEVNSFKVRFGQSSSSAFPLDQIIKGQTYQFSVWLRKKAGQIQDNFELDIVDRHTVRYISDANGSILQILTNLHHMQNDALTENWQRFIVNAQHDNSDQYHFIDLGVYKSFQFEFSHPQLYEIPDVNYPPVKQVNISQPQNGCFKCLHYARQPNTCECSTGYLEPVVGQTECSSPIPDTCSKYVRIESGGTNYSQYNSGDYLRIFMNDVSYGTFNRGITLIVINEINFSTISTKTYDSGDQSFDPTTLISDINDIPTGRVVLVGIRDDGSQGLNSNAYSTLQSLGLSSSTTINYRDGLAMIGKKGATQGSVIQQHSIMLKGSKANVVECLQGCDYQCATCSNESNQCDTCSHTTRDINDSCNCKDTFYNSGTDIICKSCVQPCINCTSQSECTSCIPGKYLSNTSCLQCDNTQCATCTGTATSCDLPCNSDCKTCLVDKTCDSCNDGFYLNNNSCLACNNTLCATCSSNTLCILNCGSTCKTCNIDATCQSCDNGKYLHADGTCKSCDNTKCATCTGTDNTCDLSCNSDCKTCLVDQTCQSCDNGYFLNTGQCTVCDNTLCATCNGNVDVNDCILKCDISCKTCNTLAECLSCQDGYFIDNNDKKCQKCNNSQCALCQGSQDNCTLDCNLSCKTCTINGECDSCSDGKYLQISDNSCQSCDNTVCATCNTNSTTCNLSCGSTCKECDVQSDCISCNDGFYLSLSDKVCYQCDNTVCGTCSGNAITCNIPCHSSCKTCSVEGHCQDCQLGFFLDGNICSPCDNTTCGTCNVTAIQCIQACDPSCLTCDTQGQCLTCKSDQYIDVLQNNTCQQCGYQCSKCQNNKDECQVCATGDSHRNIQQNCSCEQGYLDTNTQNPICAKCNVKCLTCIDQVDKCSQCSDDSRSMPDCNCSQGYYMDQSNGDCLKCKYDCICNEFSICSQCVGLDKQFRQLPDCSCKSGYYFDEESQQCQQCDIQCKLCTGQSDNCTVCEYKNFGSNIPQCGCLDSYYLQLDQNNKYINLECLECLPQCKKCNSQDKCTECINSEFNLPNCQELKQQAQFSFETVDENNSLVIVYESCKIQCLTCQIQQDNCTQCAKGLHRMQQIPGCQCQKGYHDQGNTSVDCFQCHYSCKTCNNFNSCSSCDIQQNRFYDPISSLCQCKKGFIESKENECIVCFQYKGQCFSECPKNTIQNEDTYDCYEIQYHQKSNTFLVFMCATILIVLQIVVFLVLRFCINKKFNILQSSQKQKYQQTQQKESPQSSEYDQKA